MKKRLLLPLTLFCCVLALAQVPANDNIENATDITSIPYVELFARTGEATVATNGDLTGCTIATFGFTTIHYRFAPTNDISLKMELSNGNINSFIMVAKSNVDVATSYDDIFLEDDSICAFRTEFEYDFIGGDVYYIIIHNSVNSNITFSDANVDYDITFQDSSLENVLINTSCVVQDIDVDEVNFSSSVSSPVYTPFDADLNDDGKIQTYEAAVINGLRISYGSIGNLSGLEFFSNLYYLDISNNNISDISMLSNFELQVLDCEVNPLPASLNFSQNEELVVLHCGHENLTSLDISQNTILKKLSSSVEENSQLNTLDISNNLQLEALRHENSQMSAIDFSLNLNLKEIRLWRNNLSSVDVSQLSMLEYLDISRNNFTNIDVTQNPQLTYLGCIESQLTTIDVSQNPLLENLSVSLNQLITIDISQNPLLESLFFQGNQLTTIDISQNPSLKFLNAIDNEISVFDFSQNPILQIVGVSMNPITTLDVTNLSNLTYIESNNTLLTTLDLSQNTALNAFEIEDNYFLESLNIRNGNNSAVTNVNFRLTNTPSLQAICVDDIAYATANFLDKGPNAYFTDDCSAVTTPQNLIIGNVNYDLANNGCGSGNISMENVMVTALTSNNSLSTFTNSNGEYALAVPEGNYFVILSGGSSGYMVNPNNISQNFTGLGANSTGNDFCVSSNENTSDVNIVVLPISETRPGFDAEYQIVYQNAGSISTNGSITFEFSDASQNFISASPAESSVSGNIITFNFTDLLPFETRTIDLVMNTNPPPTVNGDDILSLTATITPTATDANLEDNQYVLTEVVVNSFDPNDKQVLEGSQILLEQADEYLHYLVRFQNTGTASAINVVVTDELDDKLDWVTLQPISASHAYNTRIINGNFLEFSFPNINLPDSTTDEPNSHGYIAFKVKPKSDVVIGDIINGEAKIYFDYNAPIITNMVSTEIANVLSVTENTNYNEFEVYPNPVSDNLTVNGTTPIQTISIYDIQGKLLKELDFNKISPQKTVEMNSLTAGIYFVKIKTAFGIQTVKIIKK
ncbi:T9SS type A sorting domain-containing protein [uncultured Kordia sp.]|uniref:DUF7619 domain-containing protein n=1 Tax=uncultured Kordia sp. TaxID=507699 RepID=UPI00262E2DCD|nr:T9SS type A sorting domain-containing protein [uncultured Kordia sp.]